MSNKILTNITSVYTDKSINGWLRGFIWVGTIAVVYIGGKAIYTKVFPSSAELAQKERQQKLGDDINQVSQTQKPTFIASQYNRDADAIVAAFSGCDITNNTFTSATEIISFKDFPSFMSDSGGAFYNILYAYKTDLDILLLEKAFNTRTIPKHFPCGTGTFKTGDYNDVDLQAAVTNQLSQIEIGMINSMLQSKGITKVKF
jgi:hypothetical protein